MAAGLTDDGIVRDLAIASTSIYGE